MIDHSLTAKERTALLMLGGPPEVGGLIQSEAIDALRVKGLIRALGPDRYDLTAAGRKLYEELRASGGKS